MTTDDDEIPQELLLGKHQLSELGSESAKIKAMGITFRVRHAYRPLASLSIMSSGSQRKASLDCCGF